MSDFPHDPTTDEPPAEDVRTLQPRDAENMLLVPDDDVLVVEVSGVLSVSGDVDEALFRVLDRLGETKAEAAGSGTIRLIYEGQLPEPVRGGEPIEVDLPGRPRVRIYDKGHVPRTYMSPAWTPRGPAAVDREGLRTLLRYGREL